MRKTKALICFIAAYSCMANILMAAFPIRTNTKYVDAAKVNGAWDSWSWVFSGKSTVSNTVYSSYNGTGVNLTGAVIAFKMSQNTSTGRLAYINTTNLTLVGSSGIVWTVSNTNIPPNGTYLSELWAYYGSTTNQSITLGQGIIRTEDSLYRPGDSTFPWPVTTENFDDYVATNDARYLAALTNAGQFATAAQGATADFLATLSNLWNQAAADATSATGTITEWSAITNEWTSAYTWGDHSVAGYALQISLDSATNRISFLEYLTNVWNQAAIDASSATGTIAEWSAITNEWTSAYTWGDHSVAGYALQISLDSATNRISFLEYLSNVWNKAGTDATWATNYIATNSLLDTAVILATNAVKSAGFLQTGDSGASLASLLLTGGDLNMYNGTIQSVGNVHGGTGGTLLLGSTDETADFAKMFFSGDSGHGVSWYLNLGSHDYATTGGLYMAASDVYAPAIMVLSSTNVFWEQDGFLVASNGFLFSGGNPVLTNAAGSDFSIWVTNSAAGSTNAILPDGTQIDISSLLGGGVSVVSIGTLRSEVDDLQYRLAAKTFSDFGYREADSFGTPMGFQSFFESESTDVALTNNCIWNYRLWQVNAIGPALACTREANLPAVDFGAGIAAIGGKVLMWGGRIGTSAKDYTWLYDPVANSWSSVSTLPSAAGLSGFCSYEDEAYSIGGLYSAATYRNSFYRFNLTSNSWQSLATYPLAAYFVGAGAVDGYIYGFGGWSTTVPTNAAYRFSIASNTWESIASMPYAKGGIRVAERDGYLYLCGGSAGSWTVEGDYTPTLLRYDPALNGYTILADAPANIACRGFVGFNGRLYYFGGGGTSNAVYEYNIAGNSWATLPSLPSGFYGGLVADVLPDGRCFLGSGAAYSVGTNLFYSTSLQQAGSNATLESSAYPLGFSADRVSAFWWVEDSWKTSPDGSSLVSCAYLDGWTNSVSVDGGSTWYALTNMTPIVQYGATNMYGVTLTNLLAGTSLVQKTECSSGVTVRVRGWQRYGGQE